MAGFDAIGAIGSQNHRVDDKDRLDNAGGMFMAAAPQAQNSIYADNAAYLTPEQKTGSIFC
ncbi:MAG: hypothetical protein NC408_05710 [Candidatus Gastranaerophilales bacterium]|nr:hypothetical protein [Candidatus Gastranaerophilales bacterium]MCM1073301.1 hypothetical protein [Bacteroides sp.]